VDVYFVPNPLMMVLSQAYLEWEQQTEQRGEQTGARNEARSLVLRLLNRRIGNVSIMC
jgi:hypothetical protein